LQAEATCVTVPRMSPPSGHALVVRRRRAEVAAARPQKTSGGPAASGRCGPDHAASDGVRLRASVSRPDHDARACRAAAAVRSAAASGRGDAGAPSGSTCRSRRAA
jgi:hypothetical protein